MPAPGGGSLGHSKHRKMGKASKGGFTKLRMQMDANKPKPKRKKPEMRGNIRELFGEK